LGNTQSRKLSARVVSAPRSGAHRPLHWPALLLSLLVTGTAATLAARASVTSAAFYAQLDKPAWAPPAWLFGPVWTLLYLLMAIAAWRVWRAAGAGSRPALLWTWLFFVWRNGPWATIEVLLLWASIVTTLLLFRRHDRAAALMLAPYLAWVSFASALTIAVWQRNPTLL
jgi:translocator protein